MTKMMRGDKLNLNLEGSQSEVEESESESIVTGPSDSVLDQS